MTVFGALLYSPGHRSLIAGTHLALLGFFGGLFAVPLGALIQHRPRPEQKGGVIAAANLLSFVGIFIAAGAYYLCSRRLASVARAESSSMAPSSRSSPPCTPSYLLPDSLVRFVLWAATHTIYRIRVEGRDNIPETGGALFVATTCRSWTRFCSSRPPTARSVS